MNRAPGAERRGPTPFRKVALVFAVLLALGFAAAYAVHDRYVAYAPTAARHVPEGATAMVRFDLTHVMFYEPFRRFIAPLVDQVPAAPQPARRARLEGQGFRLAGDVRELLVALGPGRGDWVAVLGGHLPRAKLAAQVANVLREEGHEVVGEQGAFAVVGQRFVFAQAEDGAFVIASSTERALAALPSRRAPDELGRGAGGLLLKKSILPPPLEGVRARFRAGSVVAVDAELVFEPGSSTGARSEALRTLRAVLGESPTVKAAFGGIPPLDGNPVQLPVRFPREAMEALAEAAARATLLAASGQS